MGARFVHHNYYRSIQQLPVFDTSPNSRRMDCITFQARLPFHNRYYKTFLMWASSPKATPGSQFRFRLIRPSAVQTSEALHTKLKPQQLLSGPGRLLQSAARRTPVNYRRTAPELCEVKA